MLLLGWLCVFHTSNVVQGDGVSMCPVFDRYYHSKLTFADLWAPYQGHRILCHRLVDLLLGVATHWNVHFEIGLIYLTLWFDFYVLWALLQDLSPVVSTGTRAALAGVCSWFVFSTSQSEIWTNGFNLGPALNVASVLTGVVILHRFGAAMPALLGAILAGIVASYSYGNGLTYWAALTPLLHAKLRNDPRWFAKSLLWIVVAALVIGLYFHGLGGTGADMSLGQSLLHILQMPGRFFAFFFTCAGAGIFYLNGAKAALPPTARLLVASGAPICGLVGLGGWGWVTWRLRRRVDEAFATLAPWLALGLYGLFSVGVIALTRYGGAPESAISSRYILLSQYLWLALFVCAVSLGFSVSRKQLWILGGILFVCYGISYANGLRRARETSLRLRQARMELLSQPTTQTYLLINTDRDPAQTAAFMEMNRANRLSLFHHLPEQAKP